MALGAAVAAGVAVVALGVLVGAGKGWSIAALHCDGGNAAGRQ